MYKLWLLLLLVIFSCTNANQAGIVKNTDMYSLKSKKLANIYFNNSYHDIDEFLSESVNLKLNDTVYVGLQEVKKTLKLHHPVFSNSSIKNIETATFFLNDGPILTEQFGDLIIKTSLGKRNIYTRFVNQYHWQDNKVVEVSSVFDASSYLQEVNNYHNLLAITNR